MVECHFVHIPEADVATKEAMAGARHVQQLGEFVRKVRSRSHAMRRIHLCDERTDGGVAAVAAEHEREAQLQQPRASAACCHGYCGSRKWPAAWVLRGCETRGKRGQNEADCAGVYLNAMNVAGFLRCCRRKVPGAKA
jgi:hypothetical protein